MRKAVKYETPRRGGARCPGCGQSCAVTRTMPQIQGTYVIRYHRCDVCRMTFKSVEVVIIES